MPLFEYRCEECKRKFTLLVGMVADGPRQECPRCGSAQIRKLISRFTIARTEDDILDDMADPSSLGDPEDPKAMADWMRRVSREMGEDLGDDFDELVEEAAQEESAGGPGLSADDDVSDAGNASIDSE
jgi:putative FmdB family regulatory protein